MSYLYFSPAVDSSWSTTGNWFTDSSATTVADNAPWTAEDETYTGYDLLMADDNGGYGPEIDVSISGNGLASFAAICNMNSSGSIEGGSYEFNEFYCVGSINGGTISCGYLQNDNTINDGDLSGDSFSNYNTVNGGSYAFSQITNDYGTINDGSFLSSTNLNIAGGTIAGGVFDLGGSDCQSYGSINGGTFSNGTGLQNFSEIGGGVFESDLYVTNNYYIGSGTFNGNGETSPDTFIGGGDFYGGWSLNGGAEVYGGTFYGIVGYNGATISGTATYRPSITIPHSSLISSGELVFSSFSSIGDPFTYFGSFAGGYFPDATITDIPVESDILGTGLL